MRWLMVTCLALAGCGHGTPATADQPAGDPCARTDADWQRWRDDRIAELLRPTLQHEGQRYLDTDRTAELAGPVVTTLDRCRPAGMTNLRRFAAAFARGQRDGHDLAMTIDDAGYIDAVRDEISLPPLLTSPEMLAAMDSPAGYARAYQMIQERNRSVPPDQRWPVLIYRSRFLTTPDKTTYGRFFVLVPGEIAGDVDQWIQYGIQVPGGRQPAQIHGLSVVTARALAGGGHRFAIADYWRERTEAGIELTTRIEAGHGGSNCYSCHKQAVLPIRPLASYRFDDTGELVETAPDAELLADLDRRIARYGPPNFGGYLDPAAFGPPLGPPDRDRPLSWMRQCAATPELDDQALARVRASMRCAGCHDGVQMGAINMPQAVLADQDLSELRHPVTDTSTPMVTTFVTEGWMPPGAELSAAERRALVRCLHLDYYDPATNQGVLAEWLRR